MIEKLLCAVFGHKYVVEMVFSPTYRKVGCTRCNKKWAMNDRVKSLLPWDGDFEEL